MLKFSFDILFGHIFTNIEATLAGTGITFTADVFTGFLIFLILIQTLGCADGHVTVIQLHLDFLFLESRKVHFQSVTIFMFLNIGLHQISCVMTIKLFLSSVVVKRKIKEIIK